MEIREHAILFALTAKHCLEIAGHENGERLIRDITVLYGHKRGERMCRRAEADCETPDIAAYLVHGEWQGKPGENISTMSSESGRTVSRVTKCAWHDTWKALGLQEYGRYYCRYIDQALCEGFHGTFSLEIPASMGSGDDHCVFVWSQAADEKDVARRKEKLGGSGILPFDFHCQELYECASAVLLESGRKDILSGIRNEFKMLTGVSIG